MTPRTETMHHTIQKIEQWAMARDLHTADYYKQALKLGEEYGELSESLLKHRHDEVKDAIGDMFVVLTILSMQLNTSIHYCADVAYDEIKNRKGVMKNGVFVKESDL